MLVLTIAILPAKETSNVKSRCQTWSMIADVPLCFWPISEQSGLEQGDEDL